MKRHIAIQVRRESWLLAIFFLIAFCWLGFAAIRFGSIFQGFEMSLPGEKRFVVVYGPVAFPLFGVVAAAAFLFAGVQFHNRWTQWALVAVFVLLIILALRALLGSFFGPAIQVNPASALDGRSPARLTILVHWPAASEPHRSA